MGGCPRPKGPRAAARQHPGPKGRGAGELELDFNEQELVEKSASVDREVIFQISNFFCQRPLYKNTVNREKSRFSGKKYDKSMLLSSVDHEILHSSSPPGHEKNPEHFMKIDRSVFPKKIIDTDDHNLCSNVSRTIHDRAII